MLLSLLLLTMLKPVKTSCTCSSVKAPNASQALANSKQWLSGQQDVFTFVLSNPMLLEELNECEHGVLDFFGHLKHLAKSQVQTQDPPRCVLAQLAACIVDGTLQRISQGGVDELFQPFGGDSIRKIEPLVNAVLPSQHFFIIHRVPKLLNIVFRFILPIRTRQIRCGLVQIGGVANVHPIHRFSSLVSRVYSTDNRHDCALNLLG